MKEAGNRYLQQTIASDALRKGKMAFVSGPRQVGKTTLAKSLLSEVGQLSHYFSWDEEEFQRRWIDSPKSVLGDLEVGSHPIPRVALDELHKHTRWKSSLKGLYDTLKQRTEIIVTGSARLDFFRKGGDSLAGRYFPYRLHPFSLGECSRVKPPPNLDFLEHASSRFPLEALLELGGFPEPLLGGSAAESARWRRLHRERVIREDLRDLRSVRDIRLIETLAILLAGQAGMPGFSLNSLRQSLKISFATVQDWVGLLESVYYCFLIRPYSRNIARGLAQSPKLYLHDWSALADPGARFENLVACHLLKACQAWTDCAMGEFALHYVRDKEKREVDFLVLREGKPYLLAEAKLAESNFSPHLLRFAEILKPRFAIQVVQKLTREKKTLAGDIPVRLMAAEKFLSALP